MADEHSTTKRCSVCKTEKPFSDFCKNASNKDGRFSYCRPCATKKRTEWREKNKDKDRDAMRRYMAKIGPALKVRNNAQYKKIA